MKKITLLFLSFCMIGFTINAQSTSFEGAEGYSLGALDGQNGWTLLSGADAQVTDAQASDGAFSLELVPNNGQALQGAFSPTFTSNMDAIITVDMFLESAPVGGELSDTDFVTQTPSEGFLTTRINFAFDGTINVLDDLGSGAAFNDTGATVIRDAWFELKMEFIFSDNQILYYIDDTLIFTGTVWAGGSIEQWIPLFDNFESSSVFDNFTYQDGLTLSTQEEVFTGTEITAFPNPTQGNLNINFSKDIGNTKINIIDVTGQSVLTTEIQGVGSKTLNTNNLASGVYFAQLSSDSVNSTIKFIKN